MKATKCFHKLSGSKIFNIGCWHFMHSHGRKIHNRISPCIHPPPSFYQLQMNYKCISFIVNSKYLILKAIILFHKTGVIDFNSGEQTRSANFIKDYCIFFASVLCQFVDKPLLYLFVMPFTMANRALGAAANRKVETFNLHSENHIFLILCACLRGWPAGPVSVSALSHFNATNVCRFPPFCEYLHEAGKKKIYSAGKR